MPKKIATMKHAQEANCSKKMFGHGGLGKSLENDRRRQQKDRDAPTKKVTGVAESQNARSVLEQTSLDEFIASADLECANFESNRGEHMQTVDCNARLVSALSAPVSIAEKERMATALRVKVPIPRRPEWHEGMSSEELSRLEGEAFLNWRRGLAKIEEEKGFTMTPYERNLDFWRQLWRCVERSDLLVQILDARDPEFYRCHDLERYVGQWPNKKHLLLVNKADFLSPEIRRSWKAHFEAVGVDVVFFSALRELHRQHRLPARSSEDDAPDEAKLPAHGPLIGDDDGEMLDCDRLLEELRARLPAEEESGDAGEADSKRGVAGFVGYPNVGKSSVINALFGAKKVSMSRTPGKTKHLQTLELVGANVTLCDCPGLVFPSVVATKAHLVINGTVPLTELKEALAPARLVVEKVGLQYLLEKFGLSAGALDDAAKRLGDDDGAADQPRAFMAALAVSRQHFLRLGVPDEGWGARRILKEYVTGEILYCEPPKGFAPPARGKAASGPVVAAAEAQASAASSTAESTPAREAAAVVEPAAAEASDSDDFDDLDDFLNERAGEKGTTKRGDRKQNKKAQKGGANLTKAA